MKTTIRWIATILLVGMSGGCGGGGGGAAGIGGSAAASTPDAPVTPSTPASVTPSVASAPRNIAWWGDSLTALCAPALQQALPDRTVFNGGVSGQTSAQIFARVSADVDHKGWINIFWYGHNDYYKDDTKANVASSVAWLAGNPGFLVLSMLSWSATGYRGTAEYADTIRTNDAFAATYPDNYVDMRAYLVGLYDPSSPQDVQDHANDLTPTSLRFDTIHLNSAGCSAVAARLKRAIAEKGW